MSSSSSNFDPVEELAEEFAARYRRGERPSLTEYTARYPDLAERIRDLFPALVMMEELGPGDSPVTGVFVDTASEAVPPPQLGDFRILREVGRGGMGVVYEAIQESLGRHVALKVLPPHGLSKPLHLERFRREAKAAAGLHHTNIVPVYGVGEWRAGDVSPPIHYYAMQFIHGQGLDVVLQDVKRLWASKGRTVAGPEAPERALSVSMAQGLLTGEFANNAGEGNPNGKSEVPGPAAESSTPSGDASLVVSQPAQQTELEYFRSVARVGVQVADALAYAHQHGVLHRDIKPANLLLDARGVVWVTDFGLAKSEGSDDLTHTGDLVGTIRYMAPERFEGRSDSRGDTYGLGVTLYEMLALRPAFEDSNRARLVERIAHSEPARLRQQDRRIPRDLETIVQKAMAKEPADRYASAAALADDLRRFLAGEVILARPAGRVEKLWRWARRRPAVAALVLVSAVASLALVGVAVGAFYSMELHEANKVAVQALQEVEEQRQIAEQALDRERLLKYYLNIALADAGWQANDLVRMDSLLKDCPEKRRDWEWHYLNRLQHSNLLSVELPSMLTSVAFSPDGRQLAAAGTNGMVKVLDAVTGREIHSLIGHSENVVWKVAFSPDGTRLASAGFDKRILIWDLAGGQLLLKISDQGHTDRIMGLSFDPTGTRLVSASHDMTVRVWNTVTGGKLHELKGHLGYVESAVFSPDGTRIASASVDGTVRLWDTAKGSVIRILPGPKSGLTRGLAFSPEGTRLAAGTQDGPIIVWDATTGEKLRTLTGHTGAVWSMAYSPEGDQLASAAVDQTIRLWDVAAGREVLTLKGHASEVQSVAFSPDGTRLASGSVDGTVKCWDVTLGQEARTLRGHADAVRGVACSPDGKLIASASHDGTVRLWDAETGQAVGKLGGHKAGVLRLAFSPSGRLLASTSVDRTVKLWETATGLEVRTLKGHEGEVWDVVFSPDGNTLASASFDGTVRLWDVSNGHELRRLKEKEGHTDRVGAVAFSPDGKRLASGSWDTTAKIWEVATGTVLQTLRGHLSGVHGVAFSPDGASLVTGGDDNVVRIWDLATGQERRPELKGHAGSVGTVAFTPNGQRLASASEDGTVRIWDTSTWREVLTLRGHAGATYDVAVSADGRRIVSASADGTVKVWDARPVTPETGAEREALGLLEYLFAKPLSKADVRAYLRSSSTISPKAAETGIRLVERYREEPDAKRYYAAAWPVLRHPYANPFQHRFALMQAETACRLAPEEAKYRTALGAAQYRAGKYGEARETLRKAEKDNKDIPPNLAFLAMAQHRLGKNDEANSTLARLREIAKQERWAKDAEAQVLLRETEELIEGKPAGMK